MERRAPCRCLLADVDPEGVYRSVRELVAALDDDKRADGETYEKRLGICGECENLSDGMCVLCGCFVELRAASRANGCPALPHKW